MSTKLASAPYFVINQTAVTTSVISEITKILQRDNIAYVFEWSNGSGTPLGTFTVQIRNADSENWQALNFGTAISLSGNSGDHAANITAIGFSQIRINYTPTQGQVDLSVSVVTKKIGG